MNSNNILINPEGDSLFHCISSILEQARGNVVRSINSNMVLAYWMIGREIVLELQGAEERNDRSRSGKTAEESSIVRSEYKRGEDEGVL